MTYSEEDKLKALAIVNIFETGRPLGDAAACVVLADGAGVSYGISQFTHRSGSLAAVVRAYLSGDGKIAAGVLREFLPRLEDTSVRSVAALSTDKRLAGALRAAAVSREMREAQAQTAFRLYLEPALRECANRGLSEPLSLAVVYDSINHGGFGFIAAKVPTRSPAGAVIAEKAWVLDYLRKRQLWLANSPRLKATTYRTRFFLSQIAVGNWELKLPLNVHGYELTRLPVEVDVAPAARPAASPVEAPAPPAASKNQTAPMPDVPAPSATLSQRLDQAAGTLDTVSARADSVKSLWTTIGGTLWQAAWAVFGFVAGLPVEVWIVVAVIAAALMLAYLYRQIELGRMREVSVRGKQ